MLVARCVVIGLVVVGLMAWSFGSASAKEGPSWSRGGSGWAGSGTVFLSGGRHVGSSSGSADCPGCSWEVIPICDYEGPEACSILHDCPPGRPFVLIVVRAPNAAPNFAGGQCLNSDPVSAADLGRMVAQRVRQEAPSADPAFQPRTAALTALPTIFRSGQPSEIRRSETIAGIPVDFRARARWLWTWGDGTRSTSTSSPGGSWPTMAVTHTYRRPGSKVVTIKTTWEAEYSVNGVGPFPVSGDPVEQIATLRVPVKEARAVLIGANLG